MVIGVEKGDRSIGYLKASKSIGIECKIIDCRRNDVLQKLQNVDAFIWHWSHQNPREKRTAVAILKSAELFNIKTYPNTNTCWMFDDKIYEKYLLEAVHAPMIPTFVFYEYSTAIKWLRTCKYPIVYKLPQGAGSTGVKLIEDYHSAKRLCKKHFSLIGIPELISDINSLKKIKEAWELLNQPIIKFGNNKKGCIYFQEYLPNNPYDIRVTTIGNKNYIFKRYVRENDFRASGSGKIDYKVSLKDLEAIKIARKITESISAQSMAYDFLYDRDGKLKVCEMSYGFAEKAVNNTHGWYDLDLNFHNETVDVYKEIVHLLVREVGI